MALQVAATAGLWITSILLLATTLWRLRKPLDAALLVPGGWLLVIPFQALLLADKLQFTGNARDQMYIGISIANLAFIGFQGLAELGVLARLQGLEGRPGDVVGGDGGQRATCAQGIS